MGANAMACLTFTEIIKASKSFDQILMLNLLNQSEIGVID
jgi:hypothetical protein